MPIRSIPLIFSVFSMSLVNSCGYEAPRPGKKVVAVLETEKSLELRSFEEAPTNDYQIDFSFMFQELKAGKFDPDQFQSGFGVDPRVEVVSLDLNSCSSGHRESDFSPQDPKLSLVLGDSDCSLSVNSFRFEGLDYFPLDPVASWHDGDVHIFASGANRIKILVKKGLNPLLKASEEIVFLFAKENDPISKGFSKEFIGDSYSLTTANLKAPALQIASAKIGLHKDQNRVSLDLLLHCDERLDQESKKAFCQGNSLQDLGYGFLIHEGSDFLSTAEVIEAAKGQQMISANQLVEPGELGLDNGGVSLLGLDFIIPEQTADVQVFFYIATPESSFRYISLDLDEMIGTVLKSRDGQ